MIGSFEMRQIAHIENDFDGKFGVPRQSGLADSLCSSIVLEEPYRDPSTLRGLEGFSHLWLVWVFSENIGKEWSPTVRPPRLGGNKRMGVFATRSPFRPNPIGLSCVAIDHVELSTPRGPVLYVRGADLMNGTPILDIKPYVPYADCQPDAKSGFSMGPGGDQLQVECEETLLSLIPKEKQNALLQILSQDPRPGYKHNDPRPFGLTFAGYNVRFTVTENVLTVTEIEKE